MTTKPYRCIWADLPLRILAAMLGGYAVCWSLITLLCAWLPLAKVTVWYLSGQLAPLPLLVGVLWAFAAPSAWRAVLWPLGVAAILQLLAVLP